MNGSYLDNFSRNLIDRAESDCAETDPGMVAAAAMVYVGDVYALLVCRGNTERPQAVSAARERDEELSPFIR
jgi:hypothetical protein